jgi:hypothetical protein
MVGSSRGVALTVFALLSTLMLMSGLIGMVVALGSVPLMLLAAGAVGGLLLLFVPTPQIVVVLVGLSLFGTGVAMYYAKVAQAHWVPYALALWLWLKLPIDGALRTPGTRRAATEPTVLLVVFALWFAVAVAGAVVNQSSLLSWLVGARSHLFIWSLAIALGIGTLGAVGLRRAWLALVALAALQLPFAAQQHFVQFGAGASWDSVVGTFGGDPEGGGASGAMVIYLAVMLGIVAALWRRGQMGSRTALAAAAAIVATVALAEVKAFFVLGPLMLAGVFVRDLVSRPLFGLSALAAAATLTAGLFFYYQQAYFQDTVRGAAHKSTTDYLAYIASADGQLDMVNRRTGEVSRLGAPLLWARESARDGAARQLVGYGLRASRTGGLLGAGEAARKFGFNLTTSAVTVLLWEVGVLGLAIFAALLAATAAVAQRAARHPALPEFDRALLEAVPALMLVLAASCFYNDAVVAHFTIQTLLAFVVGYVVFWHRRLGRPPAR